MKIFEILGRKGSEVVTIDEDRSVLEAAQELVRHNIGGLVVTDGPAPVGIISERDILRLTAQGPERLADLRVGDVMTRDLVVAAPDHELRGAMAVMTERRIRHLPVVREGRLVGIVSIGDLVNASLSIVQDENQHLRQYIQGGV